MNIINVLKTLSLNVETTLSLNLEVPTHNLNIVKFRKRYDYFFGTNIILTGWISVELSVREDIFSTTCNKLWGIFWNFIAELKM